MFRKWVTLLALVTPLLAWAQSIDLLILNKNYPEALTAINRSLAENASGDLYFKQALIFRNLNQPLNAEKSLIHSIRLDSTNCTYLSEYADLLTELGNPYRAAEYYLKASAICMTDLDLKYKLCRSYLNLDEVKKAFDLAQSIYAVDSTNISYTKLYGLIAQKAGKTELAINLFESVLSLNPFDFTSYLNLITQYMLAKNAVGVVRTADRALYFFPENAAIRSREANSLYVLKEYEEAAPPFELYLANNDSTFAILKNYGISNYYNNNYRKAVEVLEKCRQLVLNDDIVYFYLGLAYKNLSDYSRSADCLIAAIACAQPVYMTEMYHHLGQVYALNRQFKQSVDALQKAHELNPEKVDLLFEIATTYEEFNANKRLALNYYNTYLKAAGEKAKNASYARNRIQRIKQELFTEKK